MKKPLVFTTLILILTACGQAPDTNPNTEILTTLTGEVYTFGFGKNSKNGVQPWSSGEKTVDVSAITNNWKNPYQKVGEGHISKEGQITVNLTAVDVSKFNPGTFENLFKADVEGWNYKCTPQLNVSIQDGRMAVAKINMGKNTPMFGLQNKSFFDENTNFIDAAKSLTKSPSLLIYSNEENSITGTLECEYNFFNKSTSKSVFNVQLKKGWNTIESQIKINPAKNHIDTTVKTMPKPSVWLALTLK